MRDVERFSMVSTDTVLCSLIRWFTTTDSLSSVYSTVNYLSYRMSIQTLCHEKTLLRYRLGQHKGGNYEVIFQVFTGVSTCLIVKDFPTKLTHNRV